LGSNYKKDDLKFSTVVSKKVHGANSILMLENGEQLNVGRFTPISKGDRVKRDGKVTSVLLAASNREITVTPAWRKKAKASIGGSVASIWLKEVETNEELEGYKRLTQYHYRGDTGVGRAVPLIITTVSSELPKVIGFIEITSSLLANSARSKFFDATFSDTSTGVAWVAWNNKTSKKYSNIVARISRCVVFPELRGVGLATELCKAAVEYCELHWHIAGLKPLFLEITADMLRYHPFVKAAGFKFIGDTGGNADRLIKDMNYLMRKYASGGRKALPKGGGGIMALQISYAETLRKMMTDSGRSLQGVVDTLKKSPERLSDEEWIALHKVYRKPKPNYMVGLNRASNDFIEKRRKKLGIVDPVQKFRLFENVENVAEIQITVDHLKVTASPSSSSRSRGVQESFGFVSKGLTTEITGPFEMELKSTDLCLISGPSGSGKSILLDCIRRLLTTGIKRMPSQVDFIAERNGAAVTCSVLSKPKLNAAPVDQFGKLDLDTIMHLLSLTGLAEPHVFVRPAYSLSEGQMYRLSLAIALAKQPTFLLADSFCESLDRFSTIAVCRSMRKAAVEYGFGCIVATARPEFIREYLRPTISIYLTSTDEVRIERHDA
jgi:ABC-type lipoprotein export system ATPase subunit/GNAT superfamily N-acetyltransferase